MSEAGHWQPDAAGAPNRPPRHAQEQLLPTEEPDGGLSHSSAYWLYPTDAPAKKKVAGTGITVINIILLAVLGLAAAGTLVFFASSLGVGVFLWCALLALVPLSVCVVTLIWIDRWEPEPPAALALGFSWGAGMAVITTLVLGSWVQPLLMAGGREDDGGVVAALVQAPLVEELCKGSGLLLLFFLRRRTFDGPLDGVVYAGFIAAGFAFTENILYFGNELLDSEGTAGALLTIFVMRGLFSPFAHVMFTATLGLCVGYAARQGGTVTVLIFWVVGLGPAMFLHSLWNSTAFLGDNFFMMYAVLQVPLFCVFILGVIWLRRSEAKLTRTRLADYVHSGWLTEAEVPMLATGAGRRRALAWSKSFGAAVPLKEFIRLATRLAFTRQRIVVDAKGAPGSAAARRLAADQLLEHTLLEKLSAVRHELLSRHAQAVGQARQLQQGHEELQGQAIEPPQH